MNIFAFGLAFLGVLIICISAIQDRNGLWVLNLISGIILISIAGIVLLVCSLF